MPFPELIRPDESFTEEKREHVEEFLKVHWDRAEKSRATQDSKFADWAQNFDAIPAERERTIPWRKASNFVVPVIRMYTDTLVAAILNTLFATKPLFKVKGFPKDQQEALEIYLECKAEYEWNTYRIARARLMRGMKYGTAITKTIHVDERVLHKTSATDEEDVLLYSGPKSRLVSFEDWYPYPLTANTLDELLIQFERQRYPEEEAKRRLAEGEWDLNEEELENALKEPVMDRKRTEQQQEAGAIDMDYRELHLAECHFEWDLNEDGRYYPMVGLLEPGLGKLVDFYHNPYPPHIPIYDDYRPIPKDDYIFGDSFCQVLAQCQEEVSAIHNDRRNNSFLASAPIALRKTGARVPHPGMTLQPAKVYTVDEMDEFKIEQLGREHNDMIMEEQHVLGLGQQLLGVPAQKIGQAEGQKDSKGVYNAAGTLAMMAEGNTRSDMNIRDFRDAESRLAKTRFAIQVAFTPEDPAIAYLPEGIQQTVQQALASVKPGQLQRSTFEIQISDTAHNREVERAQLLQATAIVSQYGQQAIALSQQFVAMQQNPLMAQMIHSTLRMMRPMAKSLLRKFDQIEAADQLPDFEETLARIQAQRQPAPNGAPQPQPGPGGAPGGVVDRGILQRLAQSA